MLQQEGSGLSSIPFFPPSHFLIDICVEDEATLHVETPRWRKRSSEYYSSSNPFRVGVKLTLVIRGSEIVNATHTGGIPNLMQHLRCAKLAMMTGIACFHMACEHQYCFSVQRYGHKKQRIVESFVTVLSS